MIIATNSPAVDAALSEITYVIGANASGKSNLLDVFRFLKDVSKEGGGLRKAVADRGGMKKLRCLHARADPQVLIELELSEVSEGETIRWEYALGFTSGKKDPESPVVTKERVIRNGSTVLQRPDQQDALDAHRLTQTALQQINANTEFRSLAMYFEEVTYLHLVPQLLKFGDQIGGMRLEGDPFGQGFLERVAKVSEKTRRSRLKKIGEALKLAVPQFEELNFTQDPQTGLNHLEARYAHHRPHAGWQREDQFSDGTLRLIGMLWVLLESTSLLLLEEPELSLNDGIVRQLPLIFDRIHRSKPAKRRQIVISTHSETLLSELGIDDRGILLLNPSKDGTSVRSPNNDELVVLESGLSVAEVMLPKTRPEHIAQLGLGFSK